jgi:hypothetical protein
MIPRLTGHPATTVLRAVAALARIDQPDRQNPMMIVEAVRVTDWASVTFVGQRHEFDLRFDGEADAVAAVLARLDDALGDLEIPLAGHFVAEIRAEPPGAAPADAAKVADPSCDAGSGRVRIAALTIRD